MVQSIATHWHSDCEWLFGTSREARPQTLWHGSLEETPLRPAGTERNGIIPHKVDKGYPVSDQNGPRRVFPTPSGPLRLLGFLYNSRKENSQ